MREEKKVSQLTKHVNWAREFHDVIGYQESSNKLVPFVQGWEKIRHVALKKDSCGKLGSPSDAGTKWKELTSTYVMRMQSWEQTHNAYLNMILRLLPSRVLTDVFELRANVGGVELVDFVNGLNKKTGLDKTTLQVDSMLVSDDSVCMVEIKTNPGTPITLQQIIKYLHGIAMAGRGRRQHRLFLVSTNRGEARWAAYDRSLLFRSDTGIPQNFTLTDLGLSFEDVHDHLESLRGKKKGISRTCELLKEHGAGIREEFDRTSIEWLDWDMLMERFTASVESLTEGDTKLMCRRLVGDFVQWRHAVNGKKKVEP